MPCLHTVGAPLEEWQRMVQTNLLGVLYCAPATSYEADVYAQARAAGFGGRRELADLGALLTRDGTWTVE